MGAGNFFSGLLSGYAGTVLQHEERAYNQHIAAREFDIKVALDALNKLPVTATPQERQAAVANLNRAMEALQQPFEYHQGHGKRGGKGAKAAQSPMAAIIPAMTAKMAQAKEQANQAGPRIGYDPGMTFGQPSAQSSSRQPAQLSPMPVRTSASAQPVVPATASQTPPMPQPPAWGTLARVYAEQPSLEQTSVDIGTAKAAGVNAEVDRASQWLTQQGIHVTAADKAEMQQHLLGIAPKLATGRVLTGSFTPGNAVPPGATDPSGHLIPNSLKTKDNAFGTWQGPDGQFHYFSIKPPRLSASSAQDGVKYDSGIPTGVRYQGILYPTGDAKMPPEAQAMLQSAQAAHAQARKEKIADQARASQLTAQREVEALFGLTKIPGVKSPAPGEHGNAYLKTLPPKIASLVRSIGTGHMPLERLGYIMTRNPAMMTMVAQAYPGFDGAKIQSYISTYKDFTTGKTAIALNAGATALKHLRELKELNTLDSRIPGTADNKAFNNKLETVVSELIKFYQMPSTNQSRQELAGTLGGYFNRDAAITSQAKSMADKLASYAQQWRNAAPSSAYEAPMPHIDAKAKAALQWLDPDFNADYPNLATEFTPSGARTKSFMQGRPVYINGKIIGYTKDGKTYTPIGH